jgi:hypothetical protein
MFGFLSAHSARPKTSRPTFGASSRLKSEVKPPSLRCAPESGWHRFMFWMLAPAPLDAAPPLSQLPVVRKDFLACLSDGTDDEAQRLTQSIERARSLRELWHLRASLFGYLARTHSQSEADKRMQRLNRHFNGRATRGTLNP